MNKRMIKTIYPLNVEESYARTMSKYIDKLEDVAKTVVEKEIFPLIEKDPLKTDSLRQDLALELIKKAQQKMRAFFNGVMSDKTIYREAGKFGRSINSVNKGNVRRVLGVHGIQLGDTEPWINKFLKVKTEENASYMSTVRDQYHDKVAQSVLRAVTSGSSLDDVVKDIEKYGNQSRAKAAFIARDQTGSILGELTAERFQRTGSEAFRWSDSGDSRVRDSHHARNGKIYFYKDDPLLPGQDYGCRCVAEYVDDEEVEEYLASQDE